MNARVWKFGDGIDTDVMAPGQYMKLPIEALAQHCLEAVRPEFAGEVRHGDVLVAGRNFGIGSSREQAPQALRTLGVQVVVARSFGGIFHRNAFNLGLFALVCDEAERIPDGAVIEVDAKAGRIHLPEHDITLTCEPVPSFLMEMVEDGGLLPHLKKRLSRERGAKETT
ncbi:MAG: 3-isopropylmalate/(R)-2-methylmalate dehydratase small subunit [Burkholderiales bacterium]|jgi:3-isopropylmalate/(R)-2-methylmalate dehydratase small subunit